MDRVIDRVVAKVANGLSAAQNLIKQGKGEIRAHVRGLPASLRKFGQDVQAQINERFGELESKVGETKDKLIDALAGSYNKSMKAVNDRIATMKALNGGLVGLAKGLMNAVIGVILKLKAQLGLLTLL